MCYWACGKCLLLSKKRAILESVQNIYGKKPNVESGSNSMVE